MVQSDWFRLKKDYSVQEFSGARFISQRNYPYLMTREAFDNLDDSATFYDYRGADGFPDFLFEPTFLIAERMQSILEILEPQFEFKVLQLLAEKNPIDSPKPLYLLPFLDFSDALHESTRTILGKVEGEIFLKKSALQRKRIVHAKLSAEDIWLFSLEAVEAILRRRPLGVTFERIVNII